MQQLSGNDLEIRQLLGEAVTKLKAAGCEVPRLDAELLLAYTLKCRREDLLIKEAVTPSERKLFIELLKRRLESEPVAYITGYRYFRNLKLKTDSRALIPRPESELLVELALKLSPAATVIDLGCGSGAIALAVKSERPDLHVTAADISSEALELAEENRTALELDVRLVQSDLLSAVSGNCDLLLANLPYIRDADIETLPLDVRDYEPLQALKAGIDGLDYYRQLAEQLGSVTRQAAFEIDPKQVEAVTSIFHSVGFNQVNVIRDLAGHERVITGERK